MRSKLRRDFENFDSTADGVNDLGEVEGEAVLAAVRWKVQPCWSVSVILRAPSSARPGLVLHSRIRQASHPSSNNNNIAC
jgi:hypothetical protein